MRDDPGEWQRPRRPSRRPVRPSPRPIGRGDGECIAYLQASTDPAVTPWQTTSLDTQPASITVWRLFLVIAMGVRNTDSIWTPFGPPLKAVTP